MNELELMRKALLKWGAESQRRMAVEECSELIKALCKYERRPNIDNTLDVVEEMVDVELMLEQLKAIFPEYESNADRIRRGKLDRLAKLLKKGYSDGQNAKIRELEGRIGELE